MEASNEFRRREPTLLAIFAAKGPAAIEFRCGDAAMTEKSYQPSRESGECRVGRLPATALPRRAARARNRRSVGRERERSSRHSPDTPGRHGRGGGRHRRALLVTVPVAPGGSAVLAEHRAGHTRNWRDRSEHAKVFDRAGPRRFRSFAQAHRQECRRSPRFIQRSRRALRGRLSGRDGSRRATSPN